MKPTARTSKPPWKVCVCLKLSSESGESSEEEDEVTEVTSRAEKNIIKCRAYRTKMKADDTREGRARRKEKQKAACIRQRKCREKTKSAANDSVATAQTVTTVPTAAGTGEDDSEQTNLEKKSEYFRQYRMKARAFRSKQKVVADKIADNKRKREKVAKVSESVAMDDQMTGSASSSTPIRSMKTRKRHAAKCLQSLPATPLKFVETIEDIVSSVIQSPGLQITDIVTSVLCIMKDQGSF